MGKKTISDEKLLELLLIHGGVSGAAAACGLSKNAIFRRLQNEDFRSRYDQMQGILLASAAASMSDAIGDAVTTLRKVVNDPETAAGTRVAAADALLRHAARYCEVANVLRRLDALEAAQRQNNEVTV